MWSRQLHDKDAYAIASREGKLGLFKSFEAIMTVSYHYIADTELLLSAFDLINKGFSSACSFLAVSDFSLLHCYSHSVSFHIKRCKFFQDCSYSYCWKTALSSKWDLRISNILVLLKSMNNIRINLIYISPQRNIFLSCTYFPAYLHPSFTFYLSCWCNLHFSSILER